MSVPYPRDTILKKVTEVVVGRRIEEVVMT